MTGHCPVLGGHCLVLKLQDHTMTKWCGRCLVLVVVWSCYTGASSHKFVLQESESDLRQRFCVRTLLLTGEDTASRRGTFIR